MVQRSDAGYLILVMSTRLNSHRRPQVPQMYKLVVRGASIPHTTLAASLIPNRSAATHLLPRS
jgi:hypothetical protein